MRRKRGLNETRFRAYTEQLEARRLLTAAFDLIGLTALRHDPDLAGIDGSNVAVAIVDTGIDAAHPKLRDNVVAGNDLVFGGNNPRPVNDHGTHVAGIVASTDPRIGVATDAAIIDLQVFTPRPGAPPGASTVDIEAALEWIYENREQYNIRVVNMSLGQGDYTSPALASSTILWDDMQRLEQAGITIVSAAGDSYGVTADSRSGREVDRMFANSNAPGILSTLNVGAVYEEDEGPRMLGGTFDQTSAQDRITGFSQRPPRSDGNVIFAPGAMINSIIPDGREAEKPGTGMASPIVAGAVALMQEAAFQFGQRYLRPDEVREIMISTADTIRDGDDEDSLALVDRNGNRMISSDERIPLRHTNQDYARLNVHQAVLEVKHRFTQPFDGGNADDVDGTIMNAVTGPMLQGVASRTTGGFIGNDVAGNFDADVDMIRLEVLSMGQLSLRATGQPPDMNSTGFDPVVRLFHPDGTQLATSAGGSVDLIQIKLRPGTYYVGVSGEGNASYDPTRTTSRVEGARGVYSLSMTLESGDSNGLISSAIPANLIASAEVSTDLSVLDGTIGGDGTTPVFTVADVDLYHVYAPDAGQLIVDIDTPFDSFFVDSYLRVFDSSGQAIAFSQDDLALGQGGAPSEFADAGFPGLVFDDPLDRSRFSGHRGDSFLALDVLPGDYYIGVSGSTTTEYDPYSLDGRPLDNTSGSYALHVSYTNRDVDGTLLQSVERLLPIESYAGSIGMDGHVRVGRLDVDMFTVVPDADGVLEIDIDSYSVSSLAQPVDTAIFVFDHNAVNRGPPGSPSRGILLAANDNAEGLDPVLRYPVQARVPYAVAIMAADNQSFNPLQLGSGAPGPEGDYVLHARMLPTSALTQLHNDNALAGGVSDLQLGDPTQGFIGTDAGLIRAADDVDLYRFVPSSSGRFRVRTQLSSAFGANTYLRVFDAGGTELAANDDVDPSQASGVELRLDGRGTYWIGISGASDLTAGYDPISGAGAADGSLGAYQVLVDRMPDYDDVIGQSNGRIWLSESNGSSFLTREFGSLSSAALEHFGRGDFNGDGADDMVSRDPVSGSLRVSIAGRAGFSEQVWGRWSTNVAWQDVRVADVTGDGLADVIGRVAESGEWWVAQSLGHRFINNHWGRWSTAVTWSDMATGDFTGDGRADLVGRVDASGEWWMAKSNGRRFRNEPVGVWDPTSNWVDVQVGDVNGDTLSDVVGRDATTGHWQVALSDSNTFQHQVWSRWSTGVTWTDVRLADVNGDDKLDLIGRAQETGSLWVALSLGVRFRNVLWGRWSTAVSWVDVRVGDVSGDGKADVIGRVAESGEWWVARSAGHRFENELWGAWLASRTWNDVVVGDF